MSCSRSQHSDQGGLLTHDLWIKSETLNNCPISKLLEELNLHVNQLSISDNTKGALSIEDFHGLENTFVFDLPPDGFGLP